MKAVFAVAALVAVCAFIAPAAAQTDLDVEILNYALNLEYLEAEFYNWAVNGKGIPAELRGKNGMASIGGKKANLTGEVLAYATEIAKDELNHVKFLRTALGAAAVDMPRINIGSAFAAAANAAFGMKLTPRFDPYLNDVFFMHGAFIFEDVGVTAYKGGAPLIQTPALVGPAAGILAVEAYHAGIVREYLYGIANATTPYNVTVMQIVDAISKLRATASGTNGTTSDDQGVVVNGMANLVPTDENGIVFGRTPQQVLAIATLGSANNMGGFFPRGPNGNFTQLLAAATAPASSASTADAPAGSTEAATAPAPAPQGAASTASAAGLALASAVAAALLLA